MFSQPTSNFSLQRTWRTFSHLVRKPITTMMAIFANLNHWDILFTNKLFVESLLHIFVQGSIERVVICLIKDIQSGSLMFFKSLFEPLSSSTTRNSLGSIEMWFQYNKLGSKAFITISLQPILPKDKVEDIHQIYFKKSLIQLFSQALSYNMALCFHKNLWSYLIANPMCLICVTNNLGTQEIIVPVHVCPSLTRNSVVVILLKMFEKCWKFYFLYWVSLYPYFTNTYFRNLWSINKPSLPGPDCFVFKILKFLSYSIRRIFQINNNIYLFIMFF